MAGYDPTIGNRARQEERDALTARQLAEAALPTTPQERPPVVPGSVGAVPTPAVPVVQRTPRINNRQLGADVANARQGIRDATPQEIQSALDARPAVPTSRMRNSVGLTQAAFAPGSGGGLSVMPNVARAMVPGVGSQAAADNALLRKWYSLKPSERGRAPASVLEAQNRGADPAETSYNTARAQIMSARLDPVAQAAALGAVESQRAESLSKAGEATNRDRLATVQERQADTMARHYDAQAEDNAARRQSTADYQGTMGQASKLQAQAQMLGAQELAATRKQAGREKAEANRFYPAPEIDSQLLDDPDARAAFLGAKYQWEFGKAIYDALLTAPHNAGKSLDEILASLDPEQRFAMRAFLKGGATPGYAGGGMIQAPQYGAPPSAETASPVVAAYRRYTMDAQAAGVPAVPFEQFAQISLDAHQSAAAARPPAGAVQMATGGPVPGGRMVFDADPNAPTDSIPAVIDGQHPAKLDSGEFIFPDDVSRYYGTKFLNGLIEKAKAALGQGGQGSKPAAPQAQEGGEEMEVEFAAGGLVPDTAEAEIAAWNANVGVPDPNMYRSGARNMANVQAYINEQGGALPGQRQQPTAADVLAQFQAGQPAPAADGMALTQGPAPAAPTSQAPPRRRMSTFAPDLNNLDEPLTTPSYAGGGPVLPIRSTYDQLRMRGQDVNAAVNQMTGQPAPSQGFSVPQYPAQARTRPAPVQPRGAPMLGGGMPEMERNYAGGGPVSGWTAGQNRAQQIDDAVNGAMGMRPAPAVPTTQQPRSPEVQLSEGEQYMLEQNRAREAAAMAAQKPAWRQALGFAGGGAVQVPRRY